MAYSTHLESLYIAIPIPIRSAFFQKEVFAALALVIPPERITGIDTTFLMASVNNEKYP